MQFPYRAESASILLTGLLVLLQLLLVLHTCDGHFVYTLDDPYIHLDLARQIATTGIYGVNPGEYAAPSSSILWPLLLAPFAYTPFFVFVPFVIGLLSALMATGIISSILPGSLKPVQRTAVTFTAVLALNLPGLAFAGMEHGLHILMSLLAVKACISMFNGNKPPRWLWLLVITEPLIRYEGILISAAILGIAFWHGWRRQAVITGILLLLPLAGFSLFLYMHDLGWLPGSVIAKKLHFGDVATGGYLYFWLRTVFIGMHSSGGLALMALALTLPIACLLGIKHWRDVRWAGWLAVAGVLLGHVLLGRLSTWESPRYDNYAIAFSIPLALYFAQNQLDQRLVRITTALLLLMLAAPGVNASTFALLPASHSIYQQQYQMGRLVRDYWQGNVAANDIGLVGLSTNAYVLDLAGLANPEALRSRFSQSPDWTDELARKYHTPLVMIYRRWFGPELRRNWVPVGELQRDTYSTLGNSKVLFLTPYPERAEEIRSVLRPWAASLPAGSNYTEYNETHPAPDDNTALGSEP